MCAAMAVLKRAVDCLEKLAQVGKFVAQGGDPRIRGLVGLPEAVESPEDLVHRVSLPRSEEDFSVAAPSEQQSLTKMDAWIRVTVDAVIDRGSISAGRRPMARNRSVWAILGWKARRGLFYF